MDRKLDLLVLKLERYHVDVCGVQETKWFGNDVWTAGSATFLHSGRPVPGESDHSLRGEGVGILMSEELTRAWQCGGEQWCAVSSRIVSASFNLTPGESEGQDHQFPRGYRRRRSALFMTVVNVYAPTAKAPPSVKE